MNPRTEHVMNRNILNKLLVLLLKAVKNAKKNDEIGLIKSTIMGRYLFGYDKIRLPMFY